MGTEYATDFDYSTESEDVRRILQDIGALIGRVSARTQTGRARSIVLTKLEEAKLWAHGIPGVPGIAGVDQAEALRGGE